MSSRPRDACPPALGDTHTRRLGSTARHLAAWLLGRRTRAIASSMKDVTLSIVGNATLSELGTLGVQMPPSSCRPGTLWDDESILQELLKALTRLKHAPLQHEPFAHINVHPLLSWCFYKDLLDELPDKSAYREETYSGTPRSHRAIVIDPPIQQSAFTPTPERTPSLQIPGDCAAPAASRDPTRPRCRITRQFFHNRTARTGHVLTVEMARQGHPLWMQMFRWAHSLNFTRLLVDRLSVPGGIPAWKQPLVRSQYDLGALKNSPVIKIDPHEYHLNPHLDLSSKVITWLFYHPFSHALAGRRAGTLFFRPKDGSRFYADDRLDPTWLDPAEFDVAKENRVIPNSFVAFAPSDRSWHGASIGQAQMAGASEPDGRRTFLGFITADHINDGHKINPKLIGLGGLGGFATDSYFI